MKLARCTSVTLLLLLGLLRTAYAATDELTLTKDCEDGFRRFIQMAQGGHLGDDVDNANVGIAANQVSVELVRPGAASKHFVLQSKRSVHARSRYFDIIPGDGATASDAKRVGRVLDEIFRASPFVLPGVERAPDADPIPGFAEAWSYGSWNGVRRVVEQRMMAVASLAYTKAVIVGLAIGSCAGLILLWTSSPPRRL